MKNNSWDLVNEIILIGRTVPHCEHFLERKLITAMLFVENRSNHYYVTNGIMKRLYFFDIVLLLLGFVI